MIPERILAEYEAEAMVAADTFEPLVERVGHMLRAGRRMVLAVREFTYLHRPPKLYGGLVLAPERGFWVDNRKNDVCCGAVLLTGRSGLDDRVGFGFGARVHRCSGNETEREAWQRYRDHQAEARSHFERRRDMTHVEISGGVPGLRYRGEDHITVTAWNEDGVATEKALGFEPEDGSW